MQNFAKLAQPPPSLSTEEEHRFFIIDLPLSQRVMIRSWGRHFPGDGYELKCLFLIFWLTNAFSSNWHLFSLLFCWLLLGVCDILWKKGLVRWIDFEIWGWGTCYTLLLGVEENFMHILSAFLCFWWHKKNDI